MKTLLALTIIFVAWIGCSFAELQIEFKPKIDEALMKEFDELTPVVLTNRDLTDSEEAQRAEVQAKARVFEVGEQADMVFAALVVRNLSHTENQPPPSEWKSTRGLPALVMVLRHSPTVAPHLAPALRQWLQYLANGRSGYYYPWMVEESAIYLLHWGGDAERPFLEQIATALIKRAVIEERVKGLGEEIRKVLKGDGRNEFVPDMPFYQRCGKYVERAQEGRDWLQLGSKRAAEPKTQELTPAPKKASEQIGSTQPVVASKVDYWQMWLAGAGVVVVVLASLYFLKRRMSRP